MTLLYILHGAACLSHLRCKLQTAIAFIVNK